jgi:hypothetical protein
MPQPISYNTGAPVSGSIQENSISYVIDGQQRNYRGGFGGLSWMSEAPAANNVIFIGNTTSIGRGPANKPLFYPAFNNTAANILYAINTLPGSPGNFTSTGSAYNWAVTNNFFINNSDDPIPRINADGMVLYVDANQPTSYPTTASTWYDLSGRNNNGTLINGPIWNSNGWFDFDGTDDWVQLSSLALSTTAYTKVAWFNPDGATSNIISGGGDGQHAFWMNGTATNLQAGHNGAWSTVDYSPGTMTGRWWFGAVTFNTSTGWVLYLNGSVVDTDANTTTFTGGTAVRIAAFNDGSNLFDGKIATSQVYNRVLTTAEIKQNYFQSNIVQNGLVFMVDANNLVSYPKSGTSTYSLTGSDIGTLTNGVGYSNSNGGTFSFDGVDDYILGTNTYNLSNFTAEVWVYPTVTPSSATYPSAISTTYPGTNSTVNYTIGWYNGGAYWMGGFYNGSSGGWHEIFVTPPTLNTWHHYSLTYNGTTLLLYHNGVVEGTLSTTDTAAGGGPIRIGRRWDAGDYFLGNIANSKVYSRALTSDEVQQNYQATKDKFLGQNIITNGLVLNLDSANKDSYARSLPPLEVLVVAGGGSGGTSSPGNGGGGGGGAGGVIYNSAYQLNNSAAITVTVGAGGAGQTSDISQGNNGSNSVFDSLTAVGGGGGGSAAGGTTTGRNGGSGGGAGYVGYYDNFNSGTGTVGQGFRGGYVLANNNAGGGGGAGDVGGNTFDSRPAPGYPAGNGGLGGAGVYYSISGTSTLYSNGGNGGSNAANTIVSGSGTNGTYAAGDTNTAASGIVIIRYSGPQAATGGTVVSANGYTTHTFTTSGTFTPALWNDLSGNNINGTLTNGVIWNPSLNGGIMDFDGVDDYDLVSSNGFGTFNSQKYTIESWIKPDSVNADNVIFSYDYTSHVQPFYAAHMRISGPGLIYFMWNNGSIYQSIQTPNNTLSVGGWYHIVGIYESGRQQIFVNGQLITSGTNTDTITFYNQPVWIGRANYGGYFNGGISVVRYYNKALSSTEVLQNYNAQKIRFGL